MLEIATADRHKSESMKSLSDQLAAFVPIKSLAQPSLHACICVSSALMFCFITSEMASVPLDVAFAAEAKPAAVKQPSTPQAIWERIKNASSDAVVDTTEPNFDERVLNHWYKVKSETFKVFFEEIVDQDDRQEALKFFVDQFGRHGAQADFRWLSVEPTITLPGCFGDEGGLHKPDSDRHRRARECQLAIAELQVPKFLANQDLMVRYYQAVVWHNHVFHRTYLFPHLWRVLDSKFTDPSNREYWWHARTFMMLAHGTSRDDLIRNVKPEDLHLRCRQWLDWVNGKEPYLRTVPAEFRWRLDEGALRRGEAYLDEDGRPEFQPLQVPVDYPFPDWKGVPPPPVLEFN